MIDRQDLKYIKNILELHNKDVDLNDIYEIMTALKEDDALTFYSKMFSLNYKVDVAYLLRVLTAAKEHPDVERSLFDSFSDNQIGAKYALLDAVDELEILNKDSTVFIWGSWYGSVLIPLLQNKVQKIFSIDADQHPLRIAKNRLFPDYENVEYVCDDVFNRCLKSYKVANLIINTSCEHMKPMREWKWFEHHKDVNEHCWFAFQSNNMFGIPGHVNCVNSLEEFKQQLPKHSKVFFEEEVEDTRGTRYMLVGKLYG